MSAFSKTIIYMPKYACKYLSSACYYSCCWLFTVVVVVGVVVAHFHATATHLPECQRFVCELSLSFKFKKQKKKKQQEKRV